MEEINKSQGAAFVSNINMQQCLYTMTKWAVCVVVVDLQSTVYSNLVHRYKFPFRAWKFNKKLKYFKFKMANERHIENLFWQYLSAILANLGLCKFRNGDEESQADIGHLTKVAIFANSRWRKAAILKIALYPYLSRNYPISSKFGMPMQISIPRMAIFDKKKSIF